MSHYRVRLSGKNFLLKFEDRLQRVGFFTTRFVEAQDSSAAENAGVGLLRSEGRLKPMNDQSDPPRVFVDEVEEVTSDDVPSVVEGFTFFPEEAKVDA
jgi:hypothetical protein